MPPSVTACRCLQRTRGRLAPILGCTALEHMQIEALRCWISGAWGVPIFIEFCTGGQWPLHQLRDSTVTLKRWWKVSPCCTTELLHGPPESTLLLQ